MVQSLDHSCCAPGSRRLGADLFDPGLTPSYPPQGECDSGWAGCSRISTSLLGRRSDPQPVQMSVAVGGSALAAVTYGLWAAEGRPTLPYDSQGVTIINHPNDGYVRLIPNYVYESMVDSRCCRKGNIVTPGWACSLSPTAICVVIGRRVYTIEEHEGCWVSMVRQMMARGVSVAILGSVSTQTATFTKRLLKAKARCQTPATFSWGVRYPLAAAGLSPDLDVVDAEHRISHYAGVQEGTWASWDTFSPERRSTLDLNETEFFVCDSVTIPTRDDIALLERALARGQVSTGSQGMPQWDAPRAATASELDSMQRNIGWLAMLVRLSDSTGAQLVVCGAGFTSKTAASWTNCETCPFEGRPLLMVFIERTRALRVLGHYSYSLTDRCLGLLVYDEVVGIRQLTDDPGAITKIEEFNRCVVEYSPAQHWVAVGITLAIAYLTATATDGAQVRTYGATMAILTSALFVEETSIVLGLLGSIQCGRANPDGWSAVHCAPWACGAERTALVALSSLAILAPDAIIRPTLWVVCLCWITVLVLARGLVTVSDYELGASRAPRLLQRILPSIVKAPLSDVSNAFHWMRRRVAALGIRAIRTGGILLVLPTVIVCTSLFLSITLALIAFTLLSGALSLIAIVLSAAMIEMMDSSRGGVMPKVVTRGLGKQACVDMSLGERCHWGRGVVARSRYCLVVKSVLTRREKAGAPDYADWPQNQLSFAPDTYTDCASGSTLDDPISIILGNGLGHADGDVRLVETRLGVSTPASRIRMGSIVAEVSLALIGVRSTYVVTGPESALEVYSNLKCRDECVLLVTELWSARASRRLDENGEGLPSNVVHIGKEGERYLIRYVWDDGLNPDSYVYRRRRHVLSRSVRHCPRERLFDCRKARSHDTTEWRAIHCEVGRRGSLARDAAKGTDTIKPLRYTDSSSSDSGPAFWTRSEAKRAGLPMKQLMSTGLLGFSADSGRLEKLYLVNKNIICNE